MPRMSKGYALFCIVALALSTGCGWAQQSGTDAGDGKTPAVEPRGVYVATDWQKAPPDYVFECPNVDGVFLRLKWAPFQPEKDKYDWSFLDAQLERCLKAGKKASFGIAAGNMSPDWIYAEGVQGLVFSEIYHEGKADKASELTIPVVWDEKFLAIWTRFVTELATHLKSKPELYDIITVVKITGINRETIEIRLPAQKGVTNGQDTSSDAYEIWGKVDYRPKKIMDAWHAICDCFKKNFPDKPLSLAFIPLHGFPYIDDDGKVIKKSRENDFTPLLIRDGFERLGRQFVIQWNALDVSSRTQKDIVEAAKKGFITGYQLEQVTLGNPECLKDKTIPADEEMFKAVFDNGIKDGAQFIEIFTKDILAYPKAIEYGHKKLNNVPPDK
jgi:hypothetical protein